VFLIACELQQRAVPHEDERIIEVQREFIGFNDEVWS